MPLDTLAVRLNLRRTMANAAVRGSSRVNSMRGARRVGMWTLLRRPRALYRFLMDPAAPRLPQLLAVAALVYLVLPIDLIPDVIPILGWLDDLGLTSFTIAYVAAAAARYENARVDAAPLAPAPFVGSVDPTR